jgi:hypothetical protein
MPQETDVNNATSPCSEPTRREFAQKVAVLATTPLVMHEGAEEAQAQVDPKLVAVEALFEIVRQRYGKFMTPLQLDAVKRSIARNQATAALLREVKLEPSDEPAFAFRADLP